MAVTPLAGRGCEFAAISEWAWPRASPGYRVNLDTLMTLSRGARVPARLARCDGRVKTRISLITRTDQEVPAIRNRIHEVLEIPCMRISGVISNDDQQHVAYGQALLVQGVSCTAHHCTSLHFTTFPCTFLHQTTVHPPPTFDVVLSTKPFYC